MDFKSFIEATDSESLQKLAEEAQDELITKVIDKLIPLMEKQANYTAYLILEKLSEEINEQSAPSKEEVEKNIETSEMPIETTGGKDNSMVQDGIVAPGGLKAQDVKDAIAEAIQVNQADKIVPFIKQLGEQYPDAFREIVKMVKVELQDGIMKKFIEADKAVEISDQINAMIGE